MYISACKNHKHPHIFINMCTHTPYIMSRVKDPCLLTYLLISIQTVAFSFSYWLVFSHSFSFLFLAQHEIEFHDMHLIDSQLLWVSRQCPRFFCTLNISSIRMNCITICFPTCLSYMYYYNYSYECLCIYKYDMDEISWCLLQIYSKHFFSFLFAISFCFCVKFSSFT